MGKHLKTKVIERLKGSGFEFVPLPAGSTPHKRGVYYCHMCAGVDFLLGAMDSAKEGCKYKKRIVVRPSRFREGLFELYTFHFPKYWPEACVANRELIKEAQRRAHALEKDHTPEGIEWRIRFFHHYFTVYKGGGKPEEGFKAYSRFYQYVYVAIYRQLQKEAKRAKENEVNVEEISFEEVDYHVRLQPFASPLRRSYNYFRDRDLQLPNIQVLTNLEKPPRTTAKFAHVEKKQ